MKIFIEISHHGYGHLSQTQLALAPYVNANPNVVLTVRTKISKKIVEKSFGRPILHILEDADPGLSMKDALDVNESKTSEHYAKWFDNWKNEERHLEQLIDSVRPDLVLSNISFQILEVASKKSIPSIALSSLNWSLLVGRYLKSDAKLKTLIERMDFCYNLSSRFIGVKPGLSHENVLKKYFHTLPFTYDKIEKHEVLKTLGIENINTKIALITFGGMELSFHPEDWEIPNDWIVLVPDYAPIRALYVFHYSKLNRPVSTLLSGVDLIITKMGFGIVNEIGAAQLPCFFLPRPGWPEELPFVQWLSQRTFCKELSLENFKKGEFFRQLPAKDLKKINLLEEFSLLDLEKYINELT